MNTEKVKIKFKDNSISAVHHKADTDKWIFLCHGFGGNKDRGNKRRANFMNNKGWNAVRFDFRGNGDSSGDFIDQDLSSRIRDLKAVVEHFDPECYFIFGTSFGGKVALHSSLELNNVSGLFLKCPVAYNKSMSSIRTAVENKGVFEFIDGKPIDESFFKDLSQHKFSDIAQKIDVPIAIIHGRDDTTVHLEHSLDASKEIPTNTSIYCLEGEKHSFSDEAGENLRLTMFNWLESQI